MLREHYTDGRCVLSHWYTPGGQLIQETHWINGTGEGIYLRQDGTVRIRMSYVNELAEGPAVYYDENGNVVKRVVFRDGQPIDD
jgi:antitoxin component YwqK of YwqJK toxin-antitoxin module